MPNIAVRVKYLSALRDVTGRQAEEVAFPPGSTLRDAAVWLCEQYGLSIRSPRVMAILNGMGWDQCPLGLAMELEEGDVIALFPPIAGG